jgi:HD-GYP domain-containing protein (c-di-GMP phosphodiesterase class II)
VKYHHEQIDGKGYPKGLIGKEIPLLAKIVAVADTFDAMTTGRPYRKAMEKEMAIEELRKCSGIQFDKEVVEAFLQAYQNGEI